MASIDDLKRIRSESQSPSNDGDGLSRIQRIRAERNSSDQTASAYGGGSDNSTGSPVEDLALSAGGGFLRGVANVAGLPVDAFNAASKALGFGQTLGPEGEPYGGSESIQRAMSNFGAATNPDKELPNEFVGRIGREIGGAVVPFAAMGAAARAGKDGGILLRPILENFRQSPVSNAVAELGSASGAGTGAAIANMIAPDSQGADMVGQIAGGMLAPISLVSRNGERAADAFKKADVATPGSSRRRAARQLKEVTDDPAAAARALEGESPGVEGADLTPAQQTEDAGLMRLERSLAQRDTRVEDRLNSMSEQSRRAAEQEGRNLAGSGAADDTRMALRDRLENLDNALRERSERALDNARRRVTGISNQEGQQALTGQIARDEIEGALADARVQERQLYDEVDQSVEVPTSNMRREYNNIVAERSRFDDPDDIPAFVNEAMAGDNGIQPRETISNLQRLRSRLLSASARESADSGAPNRRKIATLTRLQKAALDDIGSAATESDNLRAAHEFSRNLNERFRQGAVGRILGYNRDRGMSVQPEMTLERAFAKTGGPQSGVNARQMRDAVSQDPERAARLDQAAQDFVRARFAEQAINPDGTVSPRSAGQFIRKNNDLLNNYPALRKELADARSSQEVADSVSRRANLRRRSIQDRQRSRASLYLDAPVDQEIKRVLRSKNPTDNMRQLVRLTRRDDAARSGLKTAFVDEALQRATGPESGRRLNEFLENNRGIVDQSGLFDASERSRLSVLADTFRRLDRANLRDRGVNEILDNDPSTIVDLASRIAGAKLGTTVAGSLPGEASSANSLIAGGAGSRFVRQWTNRIPVERTEDVLADAVLDRNLMRELLRKAETPQQQRAIKRTLNSYLVNALPAAEEDAEGTVGQAESLPTITVRPGD